jgi:hypothetical protein
VATHLILSPNCLFHFLRAALMASVLVLECHVSTGGWHGPI